MVSKQSKEGLYLCIKDVCMDRNPKEIAYIQGKIYKFYYTTEHPEDIKTNGDELDSIMHIWNSRSKTFKNHFVKYDPLDSLEDNFILL